MTTVTRNLATDIVEALVTSVGETANWQTNLEEDERDLCLAWAAGRFDSAIKGERTHVLAQLRTVNQIMGQHEIARADVIKAVLGE